MVVELGGGIINRKLILPVLLFFSLALVLNVSASSAATVNQTNITTSVGVLNTTTDSPAVSNTTFNTIKNTTCNSIQNTTISTNKTDYNNTEAAGAPATTSTTIVVNDLTMAQLENGLSRVQAFYKENGRLPNFVTFGSRHIAMSTFEKNLGSEGLSVTVKPNTSSVAALAKSLAVGSTSQAMTAVRVFDWVRDYIGYSFYYDTKYGAAGTLAHMTGNCCDTANLLVALARDDGITARYVHGYCDFNSGWYGHVWAQLYVNGKWYTADATSYANSLGVVKNWNTATATIEGIYNTLPF